MQKLLVMPEKGKFDKKMDGTTANTIMFLKSYLATNGISIQDLLERDENPKVSFQAVYKIMNGRTQNPSHEVLDYLLRLTGHKFIIGISFQQELNDE